MVIPEGLKTSADISNALSVEKLQEEGILIKNLCAFENVGSIDRLVFD